MSEKLFCDFCKREIDKQEHKFEVKISANVTEVVLRRDACLECANKIETILVDLDFLNLKKRSGTSSLAKDGK